jgi:hypothetical protein
LRRGKMKTIFVEHLPKGGGRVNKNSINWEMSVGYKVRFIYDDTEGELEILSYIKKNRKLLVKYQDREKEIRSPQFLKCELGGVLGIIIRNDYRYEVNEVVKTLTGEIKILEKTTKKHYQFDIKAYKYKCLNDSYQGHITEESLRNGVGCPVCSNKKVVKGINDINTTHPHLVQYFDDINDTFKYSSGSNKKLKLICPDCGNKKLMTPWMLNKQGLGCNKCSDGISYPEKFIYNILYQLPLKFEVQKVFDWAKNKKYDFYIPELNMIIETHGAQHYEDKILIYGKTALEEQDNDRLKEKWARLNGIENYIAIDCKISDLNYIKNSIISSDMSNAFTLSKIDWLKCHEYSCGSRIKEASNIWMSGVRSTRLIGEQMKITQTNITKYLKKGKELGWNDYDPQLESKLNSKRLGKFKSKKVELFKDGISQGVYISIKDLVREYESKYGIKFTPSQISNACNGTAKHHKGFTFKFV